MGTVTSSDGTVIAYERAGTGPALVMVDPALGYSRFDTVRALGQRLTARFTVFTYDRRGRGGSTDTPPYAVEREVDDLAAVVAEADRFPAVSGAWFERGFERSLVLLGESMARLAERGLLRELPDPTLAAYQFAGLVMYKPMNQVMFAGSGALPAADELEGIADRAVEVFLAAYGPR